MKTSLSMDSSDQKKTRMKLKKFLTRRPTYEAVRDKGYIKGIVLDPVENPQSTNMLNVTELKYSQFLEAR